MKNILFLFLILSSYSAKSQLSKGSVYLGGYLSSNSNKNENSNTQPSDSQSQVNKSTSLDLSPSIGYFLKDKLAGGIQIGCGYNKNENLNNSYYSTGSGSSQSSIGKGFNVRFTPFVRQYFSLGTSVAIFVNASASIGFGQGKSTTHITTTNFDGSIVASEYESKSKNINWSAAIAPGFVFFPSKKWSVEFSFASLGYNVDKTKDSSSKSHYFGLSYGASSFGLGIAYYLRSN